jgi:hypothetical protein
MILRRVIAHFRKQEWTAIAIDFVIVVVGVFVGIQVANWNEREADKRLGRAYAERLISDLGKDLVARRALAGYYGAVLDSVERTNALLADPQSDAQELVVSAYRASEINYAPQTRATWDEIVSSGDTGLLPRAALESGVTDYYAGDTARLVFESVSDSAYRHRVRTIIPLNLQKALREGCSDVRNDAQEIVGFMPDCKLKVASDAIEATAAALRTDAGIQAELRYQYSDVFSARANISGDVVFLERALLALQGAQSPAAESNP